MTPIVVIANARARAMDDSADLLIHLSTRNDVTVLRPQSRNETIAAARNAAREGTRIVVAAGGDGTVSAVASGVIEADGDAVLGVIPLGTGNDFARTLGLPLNPDDAARLLEEPVIRAIDAVSLDTRGDRRWFVNVTTAGDGARLAGTLGAETKKRWGPLSFLRGGIPQLLDPTVYDIAMALDDEAEVTERVVGAAFANARTAAGGIEMAPQASVEDGLLDAIMLREGTAADLAALAARYLAGNLLESDLVQLHRARRVRVRSAPPLPLSIDGEEVEPATEIAFELTPKALRVIVGPEYQAEKTDRASK